MMGYFTIDEAACDAIALTALTGQVHSVQLWPATRHLPNEYVVAHGEHDGIGKTVYCALPPSTLERQHVSLTAQR